MKTILAYGDSNTWGMKPLLAPGRPVRFDPRIRWTGVLAAGMPSVSVIEEGLNGRTTCLDDPVEGVHLNGLAHLPVALASHAPLDLVCIGLGGNDLKHRFAMMPGDICGGLRNLVRITRQSEAGPGGAPPRVMLLAPPVLGPMTVLSEMFEGGTEKSKALEPVIAALGRELEIKVVEVGKLVDLTNGDGVHLDEEQHAALGREMIDVCSALLFDG